MRTIGFCATALALLLSSPTAAAAPLAARINALVEPLEQSERFSGAIVISRGGKVAYARGFGFADREGKKPFLPSTVVDGGSLAKPVTAAAILLLATERRLDLEASVRRYVPEFAHPATTVGQLLSHSAGLPGYDPFQPLLDKGPVSNGDLVRALASVQPQPAFRPGTRFDYCSFCYDVLALIAERTSGIPYERLVKARLFGPAGAASSFVRPAKVTRMKGRRATGYRRSEKAWALNEPLDNEGFHGGSNIYFTALDLARWMDLWANRRTEVRPIWSVARQPASIAARRSGLTLGSWYCAQPHRRRCYYTGHHQGFHNFGYWDSERKISVAFVSNNTLEAYLQPALARALVQLAEGKSAAPLEPPHPARLDAASLKGRYLLPMGNVTIEADAKAARITDSSGLTYPIYPMRGWFYVPGLDVYLTRAGHRLRWLSVFQEETGAAAR